MVGWGSQRVPFDRNTQLRPTFPAQSIDKLGNETSWVVQRQELVQRGRQQPHLLPVHISKRHLIGTSTHACPTVYTS